MKNEEHEKCCKITEGYTNSIDRKIRGTLKNIGCSVECGYSYLTAFGDNILTNLCIYLNLWLDEQKRTYFNDNSGITEEEWKIVEKLWNNFETNNIKSKCARKEDAQNISHIKERMKLLTYCINRDYIKKLCEPKMRSGYNISPVCDALYDFIEDHYTTFSKENKCIDYSDEHRDYRYHISEDCTLYNMSKTFPVFNSDKKAILDYDNDDNVRKAIKQCTNAVEVVDRLQEQTEDDADGHSEFPELSDDLAESSNGHAKSEDVRPGSKSGFSESIELAFPSPTAVTSPNDKPSNPVYYAGLSVSGVFFTSMVLYKV
ncbi:hypothetical protein PVNG_06031 [Plasmodium vivax North Korean]|uniref:Uncharacterized protein n=1 Tax=Plasmodium vivax North Korean TaxID=1035514 RepID=A0A0J9TK87_PLAVI|nr:hypothetical protein PVNG_06031 [Plasmodium vivax North Korean]